MPRKNRSTKPAAATAIYERILGAIIEHRLPPGTQLVEEKLAAVFHVSRTKIREVLKRLAHEQIATEIRNRGSFVSSPSAEDARQVFEARRLIEPALIRRVAGSVTAEQVRRLRQQVAKESQARVANDRRGIIRLSGEFHQMLAELAGNQLLARTLRELETLTCLIIMLYDAPTLPSCPFDEHGSLVDAIEVGDARKAERLMRSHLEHVERALDLSAPAAGAIDLDAVFA
jgi:DNA-binding GntR family transcriptional regulator